MSVFNPARTRPGNNRIDWESPTPFGETFGETDHVVRLSLDISRQSIDIRSFGNDEPRLIAGATTGTLTLEILRSTANWMDAVGEETVYVLPNMQDATVVGIVARVERTASIDRLLITRVEIQVLEILR